MKKIFIFWSIGILLILFMGIYFLINANPEASGLSFEIVLAQLVIFILVFIWNKKRKKNVA
tara:strand:- start:246 stop:428 length:183 start_codon:yes stop_codon:yes gene_type:complete